MARRPKGEQDDVSLFPFLSIIACIIGVLTLMISTLALAQMDTQAVADAEEYEKLEQQIEARQKTVTQMRDQIEEKIGPEAAQTQADLAASKSELTELEKKLADLQQRRVELEKVKIVIPKLDEKQRETIEDMQSQLAGLKEQLAQLERDLTQRENPQESEVSILPGGTGLNFKPHFVECAAGAIVLHTSDPPKRIRASEMTTDKDFIAVLETVANGRNDTLIFLVRSDGLATYRAAVNLANASEVRYGKLPAVGKGRIDLSQFRGL